MNRFIALIFTVVFLLSCSFVFAGGQQIPGGYPPRPAQPGYAPTDGPELDYALMGLKNVGVWYFLCYAPIYPGGVPPHYITYGPPPVPYCPPPPAMMPPPNFVKKTKRPVVCGPVMQQPMPAPQPIRYSK